MGRERLLPLAGIALFVIPWAAAVELSPGTLLPGPWAALEAMYKLAEDGTLFEHIFASLLRVTCGYVAAVVVAVPIGLALGWWKRAEKAVNPMLQVFRPISPLAWIPLGILWFGVDDLTAIFLIFVAACLPIIVSTMSAVHHIPSVHLRAGRNFGLSGLELVRHVIYPAAMPRLIVGMRVSLGVAWIVVVAAEMIAVRSGLGFLIIDSRNAGNRYDYVVAGMVTIGIIGVLLDIAMRQLERLKSVRWGYQGNAAAQQARRAVKRNA